MAKGGKHGIERRQQLAPMGQGPQLSIEERREELARRQIIARIQAQIDREAAAEAEAVAGRRELNATAPISPDAAASLSGLSQFGGGQAPPAPYQVPSTRAERERTLADMREPARPDPNDPASLEAFARAMALQAGGHARREQATVVSGEPSAPVGAVGGGSAAAIDGATFGFGDEYLAGLSAVLGVQPDGQGGANWFDYSQPIGDRYGTALGAIRQEQQAFREDRPGLAMGAELAGAVAMPGSGAARIVGGARTAGGQVLRAGGVGAVSGGAYAFGEGEGGAAERVAEVPMGATVGAAVGGGLGIAGQGLGRIVQALRRTPGQEAAAEGVEAVREAGQALYRQADASGARIPAQAVADLASGLRERLRGAGYDRGLHGRLGVVLDRIEATRGDLTLREADILRRLASNAGEGTTPDEARLAGVIREGIDGMVDRLGDGSAPLREARSTWAQLHRAERIERAVEAASTYQGGFASGLRAQFRTMLRNPRAMRGFSQAEAAAIRRVAMGGPVEGVLRALGQSLSPQGLPGMVATGGAFLGGGPVAGIAAPATGLMAQLMANRLTQRSAGQVRELVQRTPERAALVQAMMQARGRGIGRAAPAAAMLAQ